MKTIFQLRLHNFALDSTYAILPVSVLTDLLQQAPQRGAPEAAGPPAGRRQLGGRY